MKSVKIIFKNGESNGKEKSYTKTHSNKIYNIVLKIIITLFIKDMGMSNKLRLKINSWFFMLN